MPNWCFNRLYVTGSKEDITAFKLACKKPGADDNDENAKFSFEGILPTPQELLDKEDNADPGMPGWYNWRCENWGTKWDASDVDFDDNEDYINVNYSTAWGPPIEWVKTIAAKFPGLKFEGSYEESGSACYGKLEGAEGRIDVTEQTHYDYLMDNNDEFPGEVEFVQEASWEEVKKEFAEGMYAEDQWNEFTQHLEYDFVKRIPNDELPLFINREWSSYTAEHAFKERLASAKIE
jgi:hypothetical protein